MWTRLRRYWDVLSQGFWLVPAIVSAAAIGLASLTITIDRTTYAGAADGIPFWSGGPEGARDLLAVVAGSVITVAGVAFSILIVSLTLASSQFGPRLLRNFTRDRGHQISLGAFVGTFLYCILVLRTIRQEPDAFVPHVSVTTALILAIISLGVLIYFIHHVATSIQAENVVAMIGSDLIHTVKHALGQSNAPTEERGSDEAPGFDEAHAAAVKARKSGYLQAVDFDRLLSLAKRADLVLRLERRAGHFVAEGQAVARMYPAHRCTPELSAEVVGGFLLGAQRTPIQDIEYAVNQLVEVAVRALSPGVNDPFTAMSCLDWLGAALGRVAQATFPSCNRYDDEGRLRLIAPVSDFAGVADAAFNQIRQAANANVAVMIRILEVLATIARATPTSERRRLLSEHAEQVLRQSERSVPDEQDRADVRRRYGAFLVASRSPQEPADSRSAGAVDAD